MEVEEEVGWKPGIRGWWNIKAEAYKVIFELAKERLEDVIDETIAITDKSQKILIALFSIILFFIPLFISHTHHYTCIVFILLILSAICFGFNIFNLYILLSAKPSYRLGLSPIKSFRNDLDTLDENGGNIKYQLELTYFNAICTMQDNISKQVLLNDGRILVYKRSLKLTSIFLLLIAVLTGIILL